MTIKTGIMPLSDENINFLISLEYHVLLYWKWWKCFKAVNNIKHFYRLRMDFEGWNRSVGNLWKHCAEYRKLLINGSWKQFLTQRSTRRIEIITASPTSYPRKGWWTLGPMRAYITLACGLVTYVTQVFDQRFAGFEKIVLFSLRPASYIGFLLV